MQVVNSPRTTQASVTESSVALTRWTCVLVCEACADACTAWADTCVSESGIDRVLDSIRLDLACAEICRTTASVLTAFPGSRFARAQLRACSEACRACATASRQFPEQHASCRACALACEQCQRACDWLAA